MKYYHRTEIAKIVNINPETLRYYEKNQLIPLPERAENGYRLYSEEIITRLELIKATKKAGFTLNELKEIFTKLDLQEVNMADIINIVDLKMGEVENKIHNLNELKNNLFEFRKELQGKACPITEFTIDKFK